MRIFLVLCLASWAGAAPLGDEQKGRELYRRGSARYVLHNYDGAIADFKRAYELTRQPGLLFNLAQASRLGRHVEDALQFYRTYLKQKPDASNRDDVEEWIAELEESAPVASLTMVPESASRETQHEVEPRREPVREPLKLQGPSKPREEAPAKLMEEPRRRVRSPSPMRARPNRLELGMGVALVGTALGIVGGAVALGLVANDQAQRISDSGKAGVAWNSALASEWETGQRLAAASTALYVIGGAAAVAGVTLTVLGARGRISVTPTLHGGQLAWVCEF